jgi:hypothetical protein|tara:strand:+ start:4067 stop:4279 length:213 start_codon:yes stop_codon:yes gene_type:complete
MKYKVGDLIYVPSYEANGIIVSAYVINETQTIDDLWNTKILVQETLYKVLIQGKIVTLTNPLIEKIQRLT